MGGLVIISLIIAFLVWVIIASIQKGLIRKEIPNYYGTGELRGPEAVRRGWIVIAAALTLLVILIATLIR